MDEEKICWNPSDPAAAPGLNGSGDREGPLPEYLNYLLGGYRVVFVCAYLLVRVHMCFKLADGSAS